MRTLISGGGELGRMIAEDLIHTGDTVILIELDAKVCERLAEELNAVIIHGDATMPSILEKAEIVDVDVVITATNSDQSNLITAIVAKEYGVKKIIAKFNDPAFNPICQKLGIQEILNPKVIAAQQLADQARGIHLVNLSPLIRGNARVYTTTITSPEYIDRHIKDLELPQNTLLAVIYRGDELIIPQHDIKLRKGDTISLICDLLALKEVETQFGQQIEPTDQAE